MKGLTNPIENKMGIKMYGARLGDRILSIEECKEGNNGNLQCIHCNASVTFVRGYQYSRRDKVVDVPSYFRLMPCQEHEDNCRYDVKKYVKNIIHDLAEPSLLSEAGGHYIVRILMKGNETSGSKAPTLPAELVREGTSHTSTENRKTAYISSLVKLACLWNLVDNKKELEELIKLKVPQEHNKRLIDVKWEEFCYNPEDFSRLYKRMENGIHKHPVCIIGEYKLNARYLSLIYDYKEIRYQVTLYLNEEQANKLITQNHPMVCIYTEDIWIQEKKKKGKCIYFDICCKISDMSSLLFFNPENF